MNRKTGSQVSTSGILNGCADSQTGPAELFGVEIELVNGTIIKRDLQRVIQAKVGADRRDRGGVTDRQARAAVSSYIAEGWTECPAAVRPGINEGVATVSSAAHRVEAHATRADEARAENGREGGRPSRPKESWSGIRTEQMDGNG